MPPASAAANSKPTHAIVMHGVLLSLYGVGVMLCGPRACGKSSLALRLLAKGHSLISDDAPQLSLNDTGVVEGTSSEMLRDLLHVRSLGVVNVRRLFGSAAVQSRQRLDIIVQLRSITTDIIEKKPDSDLLTADPKATTVLGVVLPLFELPIGGDWVQPIETLVRDQLLRRHAGYLADEDLRTRLKRELAETARCA